MALCHANRKRRSKRRCRNLEALVEKHLVPAERKRAGGLGAKDYRSVIYSPKLSKAGRLSARVKLIPYQHYWETIKQLMKISAGATVTLPAAIFAKSKGTVP